GVVLVPGGVVEQRHDRDFAAGWNVPRRGELVIHLPVEVVPRHVQEYVLATVGQRQCVLHALAAQVEVRREPVQRDRLPQWGGGGAPSRFGLRRGVLAGFAAPCPRFA